MSAELLCRTPWDSRPAWVCLRFREQFGGNGPLLSLSAKYGVRERVEGEGRAASTDTSAYRRVETGDLVINRLVAKDGAIAVSPHNGLISPAYWVLLPTGEHESRFIDYVLRSSTYLAEINRLSKFMPPAQFDLLWEQFRTLPIPCPAVGKQRAIADYLDTETARIDALITKKRRLIDLLNERWLTSVESAVASWPSVRLKRIASIEYGLGHLPKLAEEGIPIIRATNIERGRIVADGMIFTTLDDLPLDRARLLEEGELLVVRSGAWTGDSAMVTAQWAGAAPGYDLRVRHWSIDPWSIGPQFLTRSVSVQIKSIRSRAAQPHLKADDLGDIQVKIPPSDSEGRTVVARIDQSRTRIDVLALELRRQLDLFAERRQALITAAVTGKLEIPEVAA